MYFSCMVVGFDEEEIETGVTREKHQSEVKIDAEIGAVHLQLEMWKELMIATTACQPDP